jgi:N-acetylglucosamine-6-sulfatase
MIRWLRNQSLAVKILVYAAAATLAFVLAAGVGAMAALTLRDDLLSKEPSAQEVVAEPPNFVVVMSDDLDERSMEQLDGIRAVMGSEGITFENAYVTQPLCCPSRATFLRGQYPHNHGVYDNSGPEGGESRFRELGRDQSTIATWLNDAPASYQTKYIGKYMNSYLGLYVPPGWDEWFALYGDDTKINDNGQSIPLTGNSTDLFAERTSDFIRRASAKPEPFFAVIGTRAPHAPPEVAERHQGSFADTPLPTPPNFDEADISDKPQWLQPYPRLSQARIDTLREQYRARLRSMLAVEDLLRQTTATLQQTGELGNTYIFFTSDNGFHMGNHQLDPGGKRAPYEEDIRVPLMVRGPGVPAGAVRQQLVINNDFAPTIADLAGVSTLRFVDGSSFAPLLTGSPPSEWRTAFLEEGWLAASQDQDTPRVPTHKGVHTHKYMFVEHDTGEHELYDLALDPYQLESKPQAGNEQLYSTLSARLDDLRGCASDGCRAGVWGASSSPAPETTIDSGPLGNVTSTSASFSFSASVPGATFECGLDDAAFEVCASPKEYTGLVDGEHIFRVRAIDAAGNADPTPASRTWRVTGEQCTITGTSTGETLTGTASRDVICGGGGADTKMGR